MSDATIDIEVKSPNRDVMWDVGRLIATAIDDLKQQLGDAKEIEYNQKEQEYTMIKTSIEQLSDRVCNLGSTMEELIDAIHELKEIF